MRSRQESSGWISETSTVVLPIHPETQIVLEKTHPEQCINVESAVRSTERQNNNGVPGITNLSLQMQ